LVQPVLSKEQTAQVVMVTASKTRQVDRFLNQELGGGIEVETSSLHRAVSSAKHHFINQGNSDKLELLEQTILPHTRPNKNHGLVFCNTLDSCRAVEHYLQQNGYETFCLHGSVPMHERKDCLKRFLGSRSGVLITTDLAARGLDFGGKVAYVVNFDFPHNKVDYLHRTGRTARAGTHGKVFSLVRGRDRRLSREIEVAVQSKETIEEKALHKHKKVDAADQRGDRKSRGPARPGDQGRHQGRGRGQGQRPNNQRGIRKGYQRPAEGAGRGGGGRRGRTR